MNLVAIHILARIDKIFRICFVVFAFFASITTVDAQLSLAPQSQVVWDALGSTSTTRTGTLTSGGNTVNVTIVSTGNNLNAGPGGGTGVGYQELVASNWTVTFGASQVVYNPYMYFDDMIYGATNRHRMGWLRFTLNNNTVLTLQDGGTYDFTLNSTRDNLAKTIVSGQTYWGKATQNTSQASGDLIFNAATLAAIEAGGGIKQIDWQQIVNGSGPNVATLSLGFSLPIPLSATGSVTNATCAAPNSGAINLTVAGGMAPFTFNWGGGVTTEDRMGLAAGIYMVTVTDSNTPASTVTQIFTVAGPSATDTDGDGLKNDCDLDDDNDGILDSFESGNGTVIFSEDFGTGLAANTAYSLTNPLVGSTLTTPYTFTSNTLIGTQLYNIQRQVGANGFPPSLTDATGNPTGGFMMINGNGLMKLQTPAITVVPGTEYLFKIYAANDAGPSSLSLQMKNSSTNALITSVTRTNSSTTNWNEFTLSTGAIPAGVTSVYFQIFEAGGNDDWAFDELTVSTYTEVTSPTTFNAALSSWQASGISVSAGIQYTLVPTNFSLGTATVSGGPFSGQTLNKAAVFRTDGGWSDLDGNRYSPTNGFLGTQASTNLGSFNLTAADYPLLNQYLAMVDVNGNGQYNPGIDQLLGPAFSVGGLLAFTPIVAGQIYLGYIDNASGDNSGTINFKASSLSLITDTDGDGFTDNIDNDSDNDGCSDAIEGGANFTQTMTDANGRLTGGVNATTGVPTVAGSGQTIGLSKVASQLTVNTAPSNASVSPGAAVSFTIATTASTNTSWTGPTNARVPVYGTSGNANTERRYQWYLGNPNAGGTALSNTGVYSGVTTATLNISNSTGLNGNVYYVVATMVSNECVREIRSATLTFNCSAFVLTPTITQPSCFGFGSITLATSGGTAPYTYDWVDITGTNNSQNRTSLSAGTYNVTVTDANGCTATTTPMVLNAPSNCAPISVCQNNAASVFSVPPHPDNSSYTWTLPSGAVIVSGQGTPSIIINWNGVSPQAASICVVAQNVCGTAAQTCQNINIVAPPVPVATASPACVGSNLQLNATGGATYSWSGPAGFASVSNNPLITNVSAVNAGTYVVTVTNTVGCSATASVAVAVNARPTLSIASVGNSTCGLANGSLDLTVSGGTPGYTYAWSNGATIQDISGLTSGNYNVVVTDAAGCTANSAASISDVPGPILTSTNTNPTCFGGSNGAINLTITGGTSPYSILWSNGATTEDLSNIPAGVYGVSVVDVTGCSSSRVVIISQPGIINTNFTQVNVNCFGASTGSIDLSVNGGTGAYTYTWTRNGSAFGGSTQDLTGLSAGVYAVTITDANLCTVTTSITITQPSAGLTVTSSVTNVSCNGLSNGQVTLNVGGGTLPYTYAWTGPSGFTATSKDITGRAAGTYNVTVTDSKGCTFPLTGIVITQPAVLAVSSAVPTGVSCFGGNNGSVNLTISGGTSPYTYLWNNGSTSEDPTGLSAGTYTVTITDSKNCSVTGTVTVTQPTELQITATKTDVVCNGASTGTINLSVSGGTGAYTYSWSSGGASSPSRTNLSAGIYRITVTDANNCSKIIAVTINQNPLIIINGVTKDALCRNGATGEIAVNVNGGVGPYTYAWSNGLPAQANQTGLLAGTYTVTVTDQAGCAKTSSFTVNQPVQLVATGVTTDVSCFEGANGAIDLSVTGGISPYSYAWSSGANTQDITGRIAGTYTVTVTDLNLCTTTASFTLTQPIQLSFQGTVTPNCDGQTNGSISINASGGTAPYSYAWTGVGTGSNPRTGLGTGLYRVTVTDAKGCTKVDSLELKPLTISLSKVDRTCTVANGMAVVGASGGLEPYTYLWNNGATTSQIENLNAGVYTVTVTAGGCTKTGSITIAIPSGCLPPDAKNDVFTTSINTPITGTALPTNPANPGYDSDPVYPLNQLTFENIEALNPSIGTIVYDTLGGFVFTPALNYTGTFSLLYEVCNPLSLCDTARINITVNCPTITLGGATTVCAGSTANVTPNTGGTWTSSNTAIATITNAGVVTGVAAGTVTLTFTQTGTTCTATRSFTVIPLNTASSVATTTLCINTPITRTQATTGATGIGTPTGLPAGVTATWASNTITFSGSPTASGTFTYSIPLTGGCGTVNATGTIVVNGITNAGTIAASQTICSGTAPVAFTSTAAAAGTGTITYQWQISTNGGTSWTDISTATNATYTSGVLTATTQFRRLASAGGCTPATAGNVVIVTIIPCQPIAVNDVAVTPVNRPVSANVLVNDSDPQNSPLVVTTTPISNPSNGTVTLASNGNYTYTPATNFVGEDTFCYEITNGIGLKSTACVVIDVLPALVTSNNPPVAVDDNTETTMGTAVTVVILANDADPDNPSTPNGTLGTPLKLTDPTNGSVTFNTNGTITYTPSANFTGIDSFNYRICDNGTPSLCDEATVRIIVKATPSVGNQPPVAMDDAEVTSVNTPVSNTVVNNDRDPDNTLAQLTFTKLTDPANGTVTFSSNGSYTYTPNNGFIGNDSFTYRVCDPSNACDNATVSIAILNPTQVALLPKVWLQGALFGVSGASGIMRDDLRSKSLIPLTSPYPAMGMTEITPSSAITSAVLGVASPVENSIVDWVFVELRDATNPATVLNSTSALIQRDGDIVGLDGMSPVIFNQANFGNYYVAVRHRNHLGVMSASPIAMSLTPATVDFRNGSTPAYNLNVSNITNVPLVVVDQGLALWAGNSLVDTRVIFQGNSNDVNVLFQSVIGHPGNLLGSPFYKIRAYHIGDINMNGETVFQGSGNDVEFIYLNVIQNHPGNILKQNFFIIRQQLP